MTVARPADGRWYDGVVRRYVRVMVVPRAQLKVYEPLEAFPPQERERWRAYAEAGEGLSRGELVEVESDDVLARLLTGASPLGPDAALVRRVGGRTMVCPLQLDLRAAVALESFRRTVPAAAFDAFVPDARARTRLERLSASGRAPHVLDEPWAVPLHWFLAFEPDERRLTDHPEGPGPRLVYLTSCATAAGRIDRVIGIVEATVEDGEDILAALAEIGAWLDAFDPEALLELDYALLTRDMTRDELAADRTCEDLWQAVDALASGDLLSAAASYGVARARWHHRRARQHAS